MATKTKNAANDKQETNVNKSETGGNKPVAKFKAKGMTASIFAHIGKNGERETTYYKTTLQKWYKDGDEFKVTQSLGRDDLQVARYLLQKAYEFIVDAENTKPDQ